MAALSAEEGKGPQGRHMLLSFRARPPLLSILCLLQGQKECAQQLRDIGRCMQVCMEVCTASGVRYEAHQMAVSILVLAVVLSLLRH